MTVVDWVLALAGALVVVLTLNDVFQSVIVPRATTLAWRPTIVLWRVLWYAWPHLARSRNAGAREDFLAYFAPFTLVLMLIGWVVLLILGYGMVFWSIRAQLHPPAATFGAACYFAGTSLLTIGFGDISGQTGFARYLSLAAGASGLGVVSVTTAYLFSVFGAFQAREQFIVIVGARGGAPPSGVGLLAIARLAESRDLSGIFISAQQWCATLMETHLAYPTLAYFRSSHDYESWINTLGALLDAASLLLTTVEGEPRAEARFFFSLGRHAVHDLSNYFRAGTERTAPGMERATFDAGYDRLVDSGYRLRDREDAWADFASLRGEYACRLQNLADFFSVTIAPWPMDGKFIQAGHLLDSFGIGGYKKLGVMAQKP